jgi:hypothetical protein
MTIQNPIASSGIPSLPWSQSPVLRLGASGDMVKQLQRLMRYVGLPVATDGDFGPQTHERLKRFQRDHGLTADGIVGPATWAALRAELAQHSAARAVVKEDHYSPHFSKRVMTASQTATSRCIDNTPTPEAEQNLERLCRAFLERVRERFGELRITSGYRGKALNQAIRGSETSAHCSGRAADFEPAASGVSHKNVMDWIINESGLDYDQVIYEYGPDGWIHLGIAAEGKRPRREALMIFKDTKYVPYNPNDPRVEDRPQRAVV